MLEIKLPGCVVFLRTDELLHLLLQDPGLYEEVLRRGKAFTRRRQELARRSKVPARCREPKGPV